MEIHKPKAAHSLREFLTEIGTIICGILIALGLEQAVEQLHWKHEVHDEREALMHELKANYNAVLFRRQQTACIDRRLSELGRLFELQAQGKPFKIRHSIGRPVLWLESRGAWQIALSDQSLAHMPLHDRLTYSETFDDYESYNRLREMEDTAWRRLSVLDRPQSLTREDWPLLKQAYSEALGLSSRMTLKMYYIVDNYRFGAAIEPPKLNTAMVAAEKEFCSPLDVG